MWRASIARARTLVQQLWLRTAPRRWLEIEISRDSTVETAWLGRVGEELACRALRGLGWRVLHRNLRAPEAELDAVCMDGAVTVVVEVKSGRRPRRGWAPGQSPSDRVRPSDVSRRLRAARRLARRRGGGPGPFRVDLVEVEVPRGARRRPRLVHRRDLGLAAGAVTWLDA